ncbi:MAG: hypothetical protein J6R09_05490 [Alistipes sp.]|jgi:hypothetical protein|nr:hypothetical protein [Alistipes sp.]
MGASYTIRCKHCNTEFLHIAGNDFGAIRSCVGCECHVETEVAIRCPACMRRINNTEEEFNSQIVGSFTWG